MALMLFNMSVSVNGINSETDISLSGTDAVARSCHDGDCQAICGSGYRACTYMDCGAGTELCHKGGNSQQFSKLHEDTHI